MVRGLLSLPPELVGMICETLPLADVKSIRLTTKLLSTSGSFIFHTLTLDINATNLLTNTEKLEYLSRRQSPWTSQATLNLVIKCLAPKYNPDHEPESYINGRWVPKYQCESFELISARRKMRKYLYSALSSLTNVRSVRWTTHPKDDKWAQRAIFRSLRSLPNLCSLQIHVDWIRIPLPLHYLRRLKSITTTETHNSSSEGHAYQTYLNLAKLIASSANLISVEVERGDYDSQRADPGASLHQILSFCSTRSSPVKLRHIALTRMFVRLDQTTIPHLRYLRSLDLSNMLEPRNPCDLDEMYLPLTGAGTDVDNFRELYAKQCLVGSTVDEVWLSLISLGVHLEEIKLDAITPAFLTYLETYSGVRKLRMRISHQFQLLLNSEPLASQIFRLPLRNHVNTLEELEIRASSEGPWCLDTNQASVFSSCKKLKILGVSICHRHLKTPTHSVLTHDSDNQDTLTLLFEAVSRNLHNLHTLKLTIAATNYSETVDENWCWLSTSPSLSSASVDLAARLSTYSATSLSDDYLNFGTGGVLSGLRPTTWILGSEVDGYFLFHRPGR